MDDNVARRPLIAHQAPFAPTVKDEVLTSSQFDDGYRNDGANANIYDSNSRKAKRRHSTPDTPQGHFLPLAVPLSSFQSPVHEGWDELRSARASLDVKRDESAATLHAPGPTSSKQIPTPASQSKSRQEAKKDKETKHDRPSSALQKWPSTPSAQDIKKSRKQSDMEALMRVHKFGKKLQVVYHQGPKGEGQKMWNGIRGIRKESSESKRALTSSKAPWIAHSPRTQAARTKAREEQLNALHAVALDLPAPKPPLNISPPLQARPKPSVPVRPAPLGIVRSPVVHKPLPGSVQMQPRGTKASIASTYTVRSVEVPVVASQSVQYDAKEFVLDYSQSKARVPMLDPAPKTKVSQKKGLPPRPVPVPGEEEPPELADQEKMYKLRVGRDQPRPHVESLPPPPKPSAAKALNAQVGPTFSTTASKLQNNPAAGSSFAVGSQFPYTVSKSQNNPAHFASLDDRQTERPRHGKSKDKETKSRFAEAVSTFFEVPEQVKEIPSKHPKIYLTDIWTHQKDKARAKHQQKLKQQISAPRPVVAPYGFSANFATEAGGVGGPAPAMAVAPQIPNPAFVNRKTKRGSVSAGKLAESKSRFNMWDRNHDDGRPVPRIPPPVAPLPQNLLLPSSQHEAQTKGKAKKKSKEKKDNWAGVLDKSFGRTRRGSDASMVCVDSKAYETHYQHQRHHYLEKPEKKHDSSVLKMMTFKGPVKVNPSASIPDPGLEKQRGHKHQYSDESLVPEPLGTRKSEAARRQAEEVRDTRFYRPYDSLIGEYNKGGQYSGNWI